MNRQAKTAKITRETARAREALQAGADPEAVGFSAYVRGWVCAYTTAPDEPAKAGWLARFERGQRDRLAWDARDAS